MLRDQEFMLSRAEQENIINFVKNNKDNYKEKNPLENYFEMNLIKRRNNFSNENSIRNKEEAEENEEKTDKKVYKPEDISFQINIQGEITKKIRKSTKKAHPRGIVLRGPIAKWYRQNQEYENTKEKGYFDIRKIDFNEDNKSQLEDIITDKNSLYPDDDAEEYFRVRDVIEKGKLNKKDTIFTSRRIVEFGNKTFKYFFHQLQKYFVELITNITKASYNILKFLSDTHKFRINS